eukprot:scaffold1572_cov272-Pinguiococcus_pyrenoidosus.AAC.2
MAVALVQPAGLHDAPLVAWALVLELVFVLPGRHDVLKAPCGKRLRVGPGVFRLQAAVGLLDDALQPVLHFQSGGSLVSVVRSTLRSQDDQRVGRAFGELLFELRNVKHEARCWPTNGIMRRSGVADPLPRQRFQNHHS